MKSRNKLGNRTTRAYIARSNVPHQHHSFGKEQRMPPIKKIMNQSIGYDMRSSLTKRGAGFGIGSRFKSPSPLRQSYESPPPGTYDLPTDFRCGTAESPKRNCFSFGIGHEAYKKVYIPGMNLPNNDSPDPGKYTNDYNNISHNQSPRKSIHGRHMNILEPQYIRIKQNVPGPGSYPTSKYDINRLGVYSISSQRNSLAQRWSPSKEKFHQESRSYVPGPGSYRQVDEIASSTGQYLNSNFAKIKGGRFAASTYQKGKMLLVPGASGTNSYISNSDFSKTVQLKNIHFLKMPANLLNKNSNNMSAENTPNHMRTPNHNSRNFVKTGQTTTQDSSRRSRLMTPPVEGSTLEKTKKSPSFLKNVHRTNQELNDRLVSDPSLGKNSNRMVVLQINDE